MGKKPDEVDDPPEQWTPDKPIPDEDGEAEAQRRHMMNRRLKFLDDEADKSNKKKKPGEKPKLWG
jgi:hypothetical protein